MNDPSQQPPNLEARENRRWLIGVGISLMFGLFGVVMALLSYWERAPASAAPAARGAVAPKAEATDGQRDRRPGRRRD